MRIKNTLRANQTFVMSIPLLNRMKGYCQSAKLGLSTFAREAIEEKLDRLQAPIPDEVASIEVEHLFAPVGVPEVKDGRDSEVV